MKKVTVVDSTKVLKLEDACKHNESSPDVDADFFRHVEESKSKLEENQTKLEEVIVQDETSVEIKDDDDSVGSKKMRDLKYLFFLIFGSLLLVVAFGAIISYYIIAIESKIGYGEGTVVIYVYENGTNSQSTAAPSDGSSTDPIYSNCKVDTTNLDDYSDMAYDTNSQHPWPWLAAIEYSFINNQTNEQTPFFQGCGGAFLGENSILTAAHCVDQNYIKQAYEARDKKEAEKLGEEVIFVLRVKVGIQINSTYTKYQTYFAEEIIKHPNYTTGSPNHDLAFIHLIIKYGNDTNGHLCLQPKFDFNYVPENIYALSKANKSLDYNSVVQKAITLTSESECAEANSEVSFCAVQIDDQGTAEYHYNDPNIITDRPIDIPNYGDDTNKPAVDCGKRTSGMPLMQQMDKSSWSLVGIGSFSQNPCSKFTIYTKLDAYKDWINTSVSSFKKK